ncbi:MAG TPA: FtsX-like permease family protein [Polyangiaceae bacterium]|jgi:putative ABC transport system permease protein|nr:FtsX-like permease family protein [Polyangiaceae bacterium]
MTIVGIGLRNAWRNKIRAVLTLIGVSVAVIAFLFLRTILSAWTTGADAAAKDRLATRHKVTFVMSLPLRYVDRIRAIPGVKAASYANWFGAKNPNAEDQFFATIAVDSKTFLDVSDETVVPPDQKEQWLGDRRGAIIGDHLAKQFGWKVGDKVTLEGSIYPGDWEFVIDGIYTAARRSVDRSTFFFHWDYMNESLSAAQKDRVGWVMSRIDDPSHAADIAKRIDDSFADQETQTLTMSERAMNTSFLGMFSAILKAMNYVSIVILVIMGLILGNTIAMGVRERTHEYGVLRAIGFKPKHLVAFILGEAVVIGAIGGVVGVLVAVPFINQGVGRYLEENMSGFFPYFRVAPHDAILAGLLALGLAALVAAIPAYQASKLNTIDALRRVG